MSSPTRLATDRTANELRPHWRAVCNGCGAVTAGATETTAGGAKQAAAFVAGPPALAARRIVSRVMPGDPDYPVTLSFCKCPGAKP